MEASKDTVLVQRNGKQGAPEGFAQLVGEDLFKMKEAALSLQLAQANLETAKARYREHQNGMEAAAHSMDMETAKVNAIIGEKAVIEAALGIKKQGDLVVHGGVYFRRINGEAKPAAEGKPAGAPGDRPTPE